MSIIFRGNPFTVDGKGYIARQYIRALSTKYNIMLHTDSSSMSVDHLSDSDKSLLTRCVSNEIPYNTIVNYLPVNKIIPEKNKRNIAILSPKTIVAPATWRDTCNGMDMIIVPSEFCRLSLLNSGVYTDIRVIPPPISTSDDPPIIERYKDFPTVKYFTFIDSTHSCNWVDTLLAYMNEFTSSDDIIYILKCSDEVVKKAIISITNMYDRSPSLYIVTTTVNDMMVDSLYRCTDVYCAPQCSSPFGLSYIRAAINGNSIICNDSGGHTGYIKDYYSTPSNMYPSTYCIDEPDYDERYMWYRPYDVEKVMRDVYNDVLKGKVKRAKPIGNFTEEYTSDLLYDAISSITSSYKPLSNTPKVSIIVLSYNTLELLKRALYSISLNTDYYNYEVIVVDNASDNYNHGLFNYLDSIDYKVIYSSTNLGFGVGNNLGASNATGDILLFLNNDTEVQPGWLTPIVEDFINDSKVGIVGSKLLYPNMTIQHCGMALKQPGEHYATHPYSGASADYDMVNIRKEMLAVTGACLAIRKSIYDRVKGFDSIYERGYYEDSDLCMKVRELGYKVIYEPESVVIHKVGSSFSKLGSLNRQQFFIDNQNRFIDRWDSKIISNGYMFSSRHHYAPNRKNVGILDSYMETYGGGEKEVLYAAKALEDDNNVDILMRLPNRVTNKSIYDSTGITLKHTELVTLISAEPIKYYRDYDVFWNNEWRTTEPGCGKYNILRVMFPHKDTDLSYIKTYDKILANSKYTAKWIKEYWDVDADVLYPPVTMMSDGMDMDSIVANKSNYILTVGRFFEGEHCKKHMVMIEAFKQLVDEYGSDYELHIAGVLGNNPANIAYYNRCVDAAKGYNIVFHPDIGYDDLKRLYLSSKIYWHAAGYGETDPMCFEHFGIAPVEAMSAGCYPILYNGGGLVEIAPDIPKWNTIEELGNMSYDFIKYSIMLYDVEVLVSKVQSFNYTKYINNVAKLCRY